MVIAEGKVHQLGMPAQIVVVEQVMQKRLFPRQELLLLFRSPALEAGELGVDFRFLDGEELSAGGEHLAEIAEPIRRQQAISLRRIDIGTVVAQSRDVRRCCLSAMAHISWRARESCGLQQHPAGFGVPQAEEQSLLRLPDAPKDVLRQFDAALALLSGRLDAAKNQSVCPAGERALSRAHDVQHTQAGRFVEVDLQHP